MGVYALTGSPERRTYNWMHNDAIWGEDFTRALWSFYFRVWEDQTIRQRLPRAIDQFAGRSTTDHTQDWLAKLESIRAVERTGTITPAAFKLAAMAALANQHLLDNATTPLVQLLAGTQLPRYGEVLPLPMSGGSAVSTPYSAIWLARDWMNGMASRLEIYRLDVTGNVTSTVVCAGSGASLSPQPSTLGSSPSAPAPETSMPQAGLSPTPVVRRPAAPAFPTAPGPTAADMAGSTSNTSSALLIAAGYSVGATLVLSGSAWAAYSAYRAKTEST
jgi:hypothetical protein